MKVMVCYDGSKKAREALEKTLGMFKHKKPEVIILTVVEPPLDATSTDEESFEKWKEKRDSDLKEAAEWTAGQGYTVDALLAVGDPRKMIIEAADKKHPDLVIISRRGESVLERMVLGSVSAYVVRHILFPVVVM